MSCDCYVGINHCRKYGDAWHDACTNFRKNSSFDSEGIVRDHVAVSMSFLMYSASLCGFICRQENWMLLHSDLTDP
jgi:hypothetical protein